MKKRLLKLTITSLAAIFCSQLLGQDDFWEDRLSDYTSERLERLDSLALAAEQLGTLARLQTYMQMQDGDCDPVVEIDSEARAGDPNWQWMLSTLYFEGLCLPQNEQQAFVWAERAAQQGLSGAQFDIALWLSTGTGTTLDMEASISWAERASEGSEKFRANMLLGTIFRNGDNVVPDFLRAESYYQNAFDTEHPDAASACVQLGSLQADIYGITDFKTVGTYRSGASRGNYQCQAVLSTVLATFDDLNARIEALKWAYISLASEMTNFPDFVEVIETTRDNLIAILDIQSRLDAQQQASLFVPEPLSIANDAIANELGDLPENEASLLPVVSNPNEARSVLKELGVDITRENFFRAVETDSISIFKLFHLAGADIETWHPTDLGYTPLIWSVDYNAPRVFDYLIQNEADIDATASLNGNTALVRALSHEREYMTQILLDLGADASKRPEANDTLLVPAALNYALFNSNPDLISRLLELGASVDETYGSLKTALDFAAQDEWPANVEVLLQNGANPNAVDMFLTTPLEQAIAKSDPQDINFEIVELLLAAGADVDYNPDEGVTPLFWATYSGRSDIVELLVNFGADVDERYSLVLEKVPTTLTQIQKEIVMRGGTPIMIAASKGNASAVQSLVTLGANKDITISTNDGELSAKTIADDTENFLISSMLD